MPQNITLSTEEMVNAAEASVTTLSIEEALALHGQDDTIFIDLRDIRELAKTGRVAGARHVPRGMLEFWIDPESPYFKDIFNPNKKYIFHCAAGWRSALAVSTLKDMGFEASHITDGFSGWVNEKGPIEFKSKK